MFVSALNSIRYPLPDDHAKRLWRDLSRPFPAVRHSHAAVDGVQRDDHPPRFPVEPVPQGRDRANAVGLILSLLPPLMDQRGLAPLHLDGPARQPGDVVTTRPPLVEVALCIDAQLIPQDVDNLALGGGSLGSAVYAHVNLSYTCGRDLPIMRRAGTEWWDAAAVALPRPLPALTEIQRMAGH